MKRDLVDEDDTLLAGVGLHPLHEPYKELTRNPAFLKWESAMGRVLHEPYKELKRVLVDISWDHFAAGVLLHEPYKELKHVGLYAVHVELAIRLHKSYKE